MGKVAQGLFFSRETTAKGSEVCSKRHPLPELELPRLEPQKRPPSNEHRSLFCESLWPQGDHVLTVSVFCIIALGDD